MVEEKQPEIPSFLRGHEQESKWLVTHEDSLLCIASLGSAQQILLGSFQKVKIIKS